MLMDESVSDKDFKELNFDILSVVEQVNLEGKITINDTKNNDK